MGATWAMKHKWTGALLPGFQFNQLDGCIDKTQIAIKLDDSDNRTLKYRLSEFKDELIKSSIFAQCLKQHGKDSAMTF